MIQRILCVLTLCIYAFELTAPSAAQIRPAQVIDQMIDALGGAAFLEVRDIHNTGRFFGFTRGELSSSGIFYDYIKFPDMERTEFGTLSRRSVTNNPGT